MKSIKRSLISVMVVCAILFSIIFSLKSFGQAPFTSESEFKNYVDVNYDKLEPIEGIYNIKLVISKPLILSLCFFCAFY